MYYDIFVLGCLMEGPCYGYRIKTEMIRRFNACTDINNNTLYSILKGFEKKGAIVKTVEFQAGKPNRNLYRITDAGKRQFAQHLYGITDEELGNRDEFMMRLYYFHLLDEPARRRILEAREAFLNRSAESIRCIREEEGSLFVPNSTDLHDFHLELLDAEHKLIQKMWERVSEPCRMGPDGNMK